MVSGFYLSFQKCAHVSEAWTSIFFFFLRNLYKLSELSVFVFPGPFKSFEDFRHVYSGIYRNLQNFLMTLHTFSADFTCLHKFTHSFRTFIKAFKGLYTRFQNLTPVFNPLHTVCNWTHWKLCFVSIFCAAQSLHARI